MWTCATIVNDSLCLSYGYLFIGVACNLCAVKVGSKFKITSFIYHHATAVNEGVNFMRGVKIYLSINDDRNESCLNCHR